MPDTLDNQAWATSAAISAIGEVAAILYFLHSCTLPMLLMGP